MSNSRADAFLSAFGDSKPRQQSYGRAPRSYGNNPGTYGHRRDRPYGYGSRIPKETPKPISTRQLELPTHSSSRTSECSPAPTNSRLDFLKKENKPLRWSVEVPLATRGKGTFVAMPSKSQWEKGFRPAWMLSEHQDPPEKYDDGFWIYQNYLKTDEVVLRKRKSTGDKTKATATNYMNNYSSTKKNRK